MEDLLSKQQQNMGAMERLLSNFKKDGPNRRDFLYIKKRISDLDSLFQDFQSNHIKLCEFDDKKHEYFLTDCYKQASDFYQEARAFIMKHLPPEPFLRPATPLGSPSVLAQQSTSKHDGETAAVKDQGTSSKLEEMLRKQKSYFKALHHTLKNIDLEASLETSEYQELLSVLKSRWSLIDTLHWEIDSELIEDNEEYEQAFGAYEVKYQQMKKAITEKLRSQSFQEKSTPVIEIPIFSGSYLHWVTFKDLFTGSIHNNRSITGGQKMQILKGKLRGEAEKLIHHLNISCENYEAAWEILNDRYNNKKLILNTYLQNLMNLPTLHHQTAAAIKKLHDTTNESLNGIQNLGVDVSHWDSIIVYILTQKLDIETHDGYVESLKGSREIPVLAELMSYLRTKFTNLESSKRKQETPKPQHSQMKDREVYKQSPENKKTPFFKSFNINKKTFNSNKIQTCPICNEAHGIYNCETFLKFTPERKCRTITDLSLCKNCLYDHDGRDCFSTKRCRTCQGQHNTLLHDSFAKTTISIKSNAIKEHKINTNILQENISEILLATANIKVQASDGSFHAMRALIDQGSQTSLISENAAQILGLPRKQCKGIIFGVGAREQNCKGVVNIRMTSSYNDSFTFDTDALIMKHLVNNLPNRSFSKPSWTYLEHLQLADPEFYVSRPIDILLGAEVYSYIIQSGIVKDTECVPVAQQTRLGWILCGNVVSFQCNVVNINVKDIQQFWAIEDLADDSNISNEDQQCVQLYESTTTRQEDGKYVVRLPMLPDAKEKLGLSKPKAVAQFHQLERKFTKQESVARDYKSFINEYIELGHMEKAPKNGPLTYYLPHHCVQRPDSATTSLRVVFNASGKTTTGISLNDVMYQGPNLQRDLLTLVLKWRKYKYVLTADLEKEFRQILVHPDDRQFQNIVWRDYPQAPLQDYQLKTVTYGTKSAPFLAMMTLRQLAKDERHRFPTAAKVLEEDFYCDDLMSGTYSIETAKQLQTELLALLKSGGFNLRKWASNEPQLIEHLDKTQSTKDLFTFRNQECTKALGLTWNPRLDIFTFECKMSKKTSSRLTKRILLSEISKIFDPLGWLAPVILQLKILFQNVWVTTLAWDDEIPEQLQTEWSRLRTDIENINKIKIPRWIGSNEKESIELHGFCDASNVAYACVVYGRIQHKTHISVVLLAAKTKLVPVSKSDNSKMGISLPKLELSGAYLLSKLMSKVTDSLSTHNLQVYGWCDSTAVLGWLHGDPNRWKPFVANRVRSITQTMTSSCWRYVKSAENPADCASRGTTVEKLQNHPLWWSGPSWLSTANHFSNLESPNYTTDLEISKSKQSYVATKCITSNDNIIEQLLCKCSSFMRVTHVLAWVLRIISREKLSYLTVHEVQSATLKIIKHVQATDFDLEIKCLKSKSKLPSKSKLLSLNPFLDESGLLRVGGRLRNCHIPEDMKHPLIIPQDSRLAQLLIDYGHRATFHGGARLTLAWLRKQYWIVGGNRTVKRRLRQCVTCRKHNPAKLHQIMGDLPEPRTNPTRPFYHTGVDYTGAVEIKFNKGRGAKTTKGYIAVFVCMVTKAVHIELVSDMTSSAFLAALRRLSARRGSPSHMYSDNGTNFVGANKILAKEYIDIKAILTESFHSYLSEMQIQWHFNAPSWPSAGGLWEASVKSLKYHLRRVIGEQKLTFEEYSTILAQLEACLNSRPLCALSEDPDDLDYLTPSHFLASGPVLTIYETERDARTRWQLAQKTFHDIWRKWQTEYLSQLSLRGKWQQAQDNIKLNDIVIIHEANLPAGKWALGRIIDLHPGQDGYVRVVSIKTKNGIIRRPIVKLSLLPVNFEYQDTIYSKQQTTTQGEINKKPPITRGPSINIITKLFLLFMMLFVSSASSAYNISSVPAYKGLYFDKLSDMRLIQDQWKVVVYYKIDAYWNGIGTFKSYTDRLETICDQMDIKTQCTIILLQLNHDFNELEYYNHMLLNQQFRVQSPEATRQRQRTRRGLVNGVGYIANSLFGVLDEHFAEQYQKDIALVRFNQKHLLSLARNQTSIIEAENSVLKRIEAGLQKQSKMFNQHLSSLDKTSFSIRKEVLKVRTSEDFVLTSIIANNLLNSLKNIQGTLLDTLTHIQQLNIHLIPPTQLRDELYTISNQISRELSLPIENIATDLYILYQIMQVKARMSYQYFIFEIKIPLVSRDSYEIYRPIPISQQIKKTMVKITPIADYLALNIRQNTHLPLTQFELQQCIHITTTSLCKVQKPIYQLDSDNNLCIKSDQGNSCRTTTTACETTWTELFTNNHFLLSCCGLCKLRFICGSQVTDEQLTGVNVVALAKDCVIKGDTFTIISHAELTNNISIKSDLLNIKLAPVNNIINVSIPVADYKQPDNLTLSFQNINDQIDRLKASSSDEESGEVSLHDVHHYVAIYCVAAAGLTAAGAAWCRARRRAGRARACSRPRPSPAPISTLTDMCASVECEKGEQCASDQSSARVFNKSTSPIIGKCYFKRVNSL